MGDWQVSGNSAEESMAVSRNARFVIAGLGLLLIALLAFILSFLANDSRRVIPPPKTQDEPTPPTQPRQPSEPEPAPITPAPPVVEEPARQHVTLPPLTRFRALVLEADATAMLQPPPKAGSDEAWIAFSTLERLGSRFAPHGRLVYEGEAGPSDFTNFSRAARAAFQGPDVGKHAYARHDGERVALWMRHGAKVPEPETEAPPGVPLARRIQEHVNADIASRWLAAMEAEFGETPYGEILPLDVVVFRDAGEFLAFTRRRLRLNAPDWSAGLYSTAWEVACLPAASNASFAEVLRHEMFHALQAILAPESLFAPWFSEGTAEWLDKAPPDGGRPRTLEEFAEGAWGYLASLVEDGYEVRLLDFMRLELEDFYANPELNYLTAYCWVDFVRAEADLRPLYFEYWSLLKQGVDRHNALARTFGVLDFESVTRRFHERARRAPRNPVAPRFHVDAHENALDVLPPQLAGTPAPAQPGAVSGGWYPLISELQRRGFDTSGALPLDDTPELLVVAIDSSETMADKIENDWFDFDRLSRRMFSLRMARSVRLTREGSGAEEVPVAMLNALIEAVLTERLSEFREVTTIQISELVAAEIRREYEGFKLTASALQSMTRRELAMHYAESIAWHWGTRRATVEVVVIDFNTSVATARETARWSTEGMNTRQGPLQPAFNETKDNAATFGADGTDCDWWMALSALAAATDGKRAACLLFTDGPNSSGVYGYAEAGRSLTNYMREQAAMAEALARQWPAKSTLQLVALPGAESEGLELLPRQLDSAQLEEWATAFRER